MTSDPPIYLQLERIDAALHLPEDDITDEMHALVCAILDRVADVVIRDQDIATVYTLRDIRVLVSDAHYAVLDELLRHGWCGGCGRGAP